MAKKRRQKIEKKDETEFDIPEFDEHKFISLELSKAKISLVAFLYAILIVFLTHQLYNITYPDARAPVVLGLFAVAALPLITKYVKVDLSEFDWKNWVGSGAVYIFSWLAIFILVINPPFSDFVDPEINEFAEYIRDNDLTKNWTLWDTDLSPYKIKSPVKIRFSAEIEDNSPIIKDSVKITITNNLNNSIINTRMKHMGDNVFQIELDNNDQPFLKEIYNYRIEAKDSYGHKTVKTGRFEIT